MKNHTEVFVSELPTCDICQSRAAAFDVKTIRGPWGNLCESCASMHVAHDENGDIKLGLGIGQRLILRSSAQ